MPHIDPQSRTQATLFPETLDELVAKDAPVRVLDAFVEVLDMREMGFAKAVMKATGRPPYSPKSLLKLYVYGALNQVPSSRRLERECHRNVEVMWLLGRLAPDDKTIAEFRRLNGEAIQLVFKAFVAFCRGQKLVGRNATVAIDGTKVQGAGSTAGVMTVGRLKKQAERLETRIRGYLRDLDANDAAEAGAAPGDEMPSGRTQDLLRALRARHEEIRQCIAMMEANGDTQLPGSDPDARMMTGPHGAVTGYNMQTAVDDTNGLVVALAVTQDGNDLNQLQPMAEAAKEALETETLTAYADTGFHNADQLAGCEEAGIAPIVPERRTPNQTGLFDKKRFTYDADKDEYRCPAGRSLVRHGKSEVNRTISYRGTGCADCPLRAKCTKAAARTVNRHVNEAAVERTRQRHRERRDAMRRRACLAEHPFAIMRQMIGGPARFLCRGLKTVSAEAALWATAFNLKRVINIVGVSGLLERLATA